MSEVILTAESFRKAVEKISNEIIKNNKCCEDLAIVGIHNKGVCIAGRILSEIASSRSEERRVGKECRSRWSPHH